MLELARASGGVSRSTQRTPPPRLSPTPAAIPEALANSDAADVTPTGWTAFSHFCR